MDDQLHDTHSPTQPHEQPLRPIEHHSPIRTDSARSHAVEQPRTPAEDVADQAWAHLDSLAKPRRSLGKLEHLAVQLARIQR
ncbi:MAG TPA: nicotinate-nucleotide--dimethylbenzimidazole phosphoribosyltransferase, partial [Steroidobacteraceae bacterium]|nr:nicotinate-nucleotide--dimethylbenzimidazole phosphoribosyltransferase [Steroidobacteraceae bacterium]